MNFFQSANRLPKRTNMDGECDQRKKKELRTRGVTIWKNNAKQKDNTKSQI